MSGCRQGHQRAAELVVLERGEAVTASDQRQLSVEKPPDRCLVDTRRQPREGGSSWSPPSDDGDA
jgi:hypothetical protein